MAPTTTTPTLRHKIGATVTPGDRLGLIATRNNKTTLLSGKGTYIRQGQLYASLLGTLCATTHNDDVASSAENEESRESWTISIQSERSFTQPSSYSKNSTPICPQVGMLILGRITRVVRPSHAMVDIVAIVPDDNQNNDDSSKQQHQPFILPLHEPFSGTLRQNEIRPNSSLEIHIEDCVRPGDVLLARVHANGERDFILTTAEAELGVVQAVCESSGCEMQAISWKEMQCPESKVKEGRKVAKPRQIRAA
mmetsp:Transcript_30327/g.54924  ORF Transcript_30327/g.54924 Transcript_30327/m.54924 type:complete len:252 (-) Transcript_30327:84-839(-)|eukprot:CAMPEP_0201938332 /NCGR_PEP_ID=MMETSP0903-20130614/41212_1 /ASSEMBLY_ACC=CAM_ASM_000552 /TAXON_ID=420261 /ORGANISM="Thalassiosira antarctica, Strain CCMP982" /LENGTH=251 /DNA_ID=CAMNT_0048479575 /DNA_START=22 /DNA_END=777 /DNA_ORIENTATION=+